MSRVLAVVEHNVVRPAPGRRTCHRGGVGRVPYLGHGEREPRVAAIDDRKVKRIVLVQRDIA